MKSVRSVDTPAGGIVPLVAQAIVALVCSRLTFRWIDDPEGPNPIVIAALGTTIFVVSLAVCRSSIMPGVTGLARGLAMAPVQLLVAIAFYLLLG